MTALARIEPGAGMVGATAITFDAWLGIGRSLLERRNCIEWELADWLDTGREQFVDQTGFEFLSEQLGIAPKKLKAAASIARSFPPALRDMTLTFGHYEAVASLPTPDALSVLKDAKARHLDDRETRIEAVKARPAVQTNAFTDEDWQHAQLVDLQRAWNRADPTVRAEFMEIAAEANGGVIDA